MSHCTDLFLRLSSVHCQEGIAAIAQVVNEEKYREVNSEAHPLHCDVHRRLPGRERCLHSAHVDFVHDIVLVGAAVPEGTSVIAGEEELIRVRVVDGGLVCEGKCRVRCDLCERGVGTQNVVEPGVEDLNEGCRCRGWIE